MTTITEAQVRWWERRSRIGLTGGVLALAAGLAELLVGPSIRPWVGDKQDTTRLGLVTIALAVVAIAAVARSAPWPGRASRELARPALVLVVGLIGFTTVGRLWWVPGCLLIGWALAAGRGIEREELVTAVERNLPRILTGAVGVLYLALGLAAHGAARPAGLVGGSAVVGIAAAVPLVRPAIALVLLLLVVPPFALFTWWSVVTPLLALLAVAAGAGASWWWEGAASESPGAGVGGEEVEDDRRGVDGRRRRSDLDR